MLIDPVPLDRDNLISAIRLRLDWCNVKTVANWQLASIYNMLAIDVVVASKDETLTCERDSANQFN